MISTAESAAPSSWTPVPQRYVHKHHADETLLTAWRRTGPDSFLIKADWPAVHAFYATGATGATGAAGGGGVDPLLFSETVRQCLPLLSHAAYDVPLGHHLLWETYDYSLAAPRPTDGPPPLRSGEVVLHARCTEVVRRGPRAAAVTVHFRALRGDGLIGTATTRFTIQTAAVYRRLRARYADLDHALRDLPEPPAPVHYRQVGREHPRDVVLSATDVPGRHRLRVDTRHPILFDHPVDHVPGILLLDAARQAAHAASAAQGARAVTMNTRFHQYVEFDAPCWVETEEDGTAPGRLRVTARQFDRTCFTASVALAPASAPARGSVPAPARVSVPAPASRANGTRAVIGARPLAPSA
ncbi:ScbA/BarX family gamma-butyrolactone biosynthesis protein [Streptomyces sp. CRN 30]|uniref:ScbA/BarX family gamma-butyrolactone biosynthesis protein n=1 Tax=Streptomyces sp. CRN 30 TaxID=3075613 RepID=UPI002A7F11BA|nr:ScbA/BarX family gamma-butyrolactone biosynthesis protein [Streptomyces sp. CRN 30]